MWEPQEPEKNSIWVRAMTPLMNPELEVAGHTFRGERTGVRIGMESDLSAEGLVGKQFFASPQKAMSSHCLLNDMERYTILRAVRNEIYRYEIVDSDDRRIGFLSEDFEMDLRNILFHVSRRNHRKYLCGRSISNIYFHGWKTLVLPRGNSLLDKLHDPWNNTGIVLCPQLYSFAPHQLINTGLLQLTLNIIIDDANECGQSLL